MNWVVDNRALIGELTWQHVLISVPSIVATLLLAVPLGRLAHGSRAARTILVGGGGIIYALPALPLFIIMPGLIGTKILDPINVVIALILYGLALLVRSSAEAFDAVAPEVRASAVATGHNRWQSFVKVELPLAGPTIVAGLRVVSASTLSLVSVGALIGVRSLGSLFTEGYGRGFLLEIGVGIIATVLLAVVFDAVIVALGRLLMPWLRATDTRRAT